MGNKKKKEKHKDKNSENNYKNFLHKNLKNNKQTHYNGIFFLLQKTSQFYFLFKNCIQ